MTPKALMRPYALIHFYRVRLRVHAVQELLAGLGIAAAVALVFSVLVATGSVTGSAAQVIHTVAGPASLQLEARGSDGFSERLLARVEHLPGVRQAAPILEEPATLAQGNAHRVAVNLVGTDIALAILDGLAHTLPISTLAPGEIALSRTTASQLRISSSSTQAGEAPVSLYLRGKLSTLKVAAVLGEEAVGALSQAFIATMPLASLQKLAGLQKRISRILIETEPRRQAAVRAELQALAHGRLTVAPADQDLALLGQALRPSDQASEFFAVIAGLLGFMFAFNAMLLTVPERRQRIAKLRLGGAKRSAMAQMVLFQALCLGIAASLVGLLAGWALSLWVFGQSPGYLAQAFTLGGGTVIGVRPLLLAALGGILATCLAAALPLADLRRGRAIDAVYREAGVPGNALGSQAQRRLLAAAIGLSLSASVLFALVPAAALIAVVLLALASVLVVPLVFALVLRVGWWLLARYEKRLTALPVALTSLKATTLRSLALIATGAVALFGAVALGGARDDLLRGIEGYIHGYVSGESLWILNPNDPTAVEALPSSDEARIAQVPGVSGVRAFHDGYLDIGGRRAWVLARPPGTSRALLEGQIADGNASSAAARLDEGGWITVSEQIASEHHARVAGTLSLPTPTGNVAFRIAATTTNLTWSPGAILMSAADYSRAFGEPPPTALGLTLAPGTNLASVQSAIERALGAGSGLEVLSPGVRTSRTAAVGREGLSKLDEISTLLILAAILAMAAALGSSIWERRKSLAALRLRGTKRYRLRRILLIEVMLTLGAGCLTGAVAGIGGQIVIDGYLVHVTGFPVAPITASWRPLELFALVLAAVLAIVAVLGLLASRVAPALALEEQG